MAKTAAELALNGTKEDFLDGVVEARLPVVREQPKVEIIFKDFVLEGRSYTEQELDTFRRLVAYALDTPLFNESARLMGGAWSNYLLYGMELPSADTIVKAASRNLMEDDGLRTPVHELKEGRND